MKVTDNIIDRFSIEFLKNQVLKNAYGNDDTLISKIDPRVLLIWYMFFGCAPWFIDDIFVLSALFVFVAIATLLARVAPLIMFIFFLGVFSQTGYLLVISYFFGSDASIVLPMLILTLKVVTVSLASVTVFSGLDPDSLAEGLLFFGFPDQLSLSISFAYRVLPLIMEEFQGILLSHRLRGVAPEVKGFFGMIKSIIYQIKIVILSFYPLMLNMAKKSRTTVEALELKGYQYSLKNPHVRKMKLARLKIKKIDIMFSSTSAAYVLLMILISYYY